MLQVVKVQAWWRMKRLSRHYVSTSSTLGPLKRFFFREWRRLYQLKKMADNSHMRGPFQAWSDAASEQRELKDAVDALIRRKIEQPRLTALSVAAYLKVGQVSDRERDFATERAYSMIRRLIMVKLFNHWRGEMRAQRIRWHEIHLILSRTVNKTNARLWLQVLTMPYCTILYYTVYAYQSHAPLPCASCFSRPFL